ncbi:hypothetical protein STSP2_01772 [Anaerohalosphaera lusitana]|uniref:Uncharacterized protein n=1 Tax=Anaerohalosphaera lusitana TaxID=1936003 RepID=A0A1U9NLJ0_9BACT|nr:hypothetical protein STSP2_01772 [Anaerohalosphaera lusitana]
MYSVSLKNMMHKAHLPHGHDIAVKTGHLLHDQRFWAIIALIAVMAFIVVLAILIEPTATEVESPPLIPSYPMGF